MKTGERIRIIALATLASAGAAGTLLAQSQSFTPVTDAMLEKPDPASWLMWRRTLDSWGYSPLKQIDRRNVGRLQLVWSRSLGPGVQEGTPLVYNGTMYFPHPSDLIQALDATTGTLKWEYKRKIPDDVGKYFPAYAINRNLAIFDRYILDTSVDNYAFALDAETGKLAWETKILDYQRGAQHTSGPIIARGKMISGRGCEPEGGPDACVIVAHDAKTGKELWRTRTIPRPGEPGDESWNGLPDEARWHVGTWMVPSYDPELNLIYVGTSVTSPAPKYMLGGNDKEHLFHNSTLALNADTGKIVWYYQHLIDHWDLDHPFERLLIDTAVAPDRSEVTWINPRLKAGERRKVMTGIPGKTGLVYTLDRQTGEFLWARPTVYQNVVGSIDGATGKVTVNPATIMEGVGKTVTACPAATGGRNWPSGAYSPDSGLMFFPLRDSCTTVTSIAEKPSQESLYAFAGKAAAVPGDDGKLGNIQAISVATGKLAWKFDQEEVPYSLLTTGGGLLFGGDERGNFRAFDQDTGKVLWQINLNSPVGGYPVTFSVNGRQYLAISAGPTRRGPPVGVVTSVAPASVLYVFALPQ